MPRPRTVISWFRNPQNLVPTVTGTAILVAAAIIVMVHTSQLQDQASPGALAGTWIQMLR